MRALRGYPHRRNSGIGLYPMPGRLRVLQMAQAVTAWPIGTALKRLWHLRGWWRPVWYRPNPWHGRNLSDPERPLSRLKLRFSTAWDEALERGLDALEDEVMRRAKDGVAEPVYYQ